LPENDKLPDLKELGRKIEQAKKELHKDDVGSRAPSAMHISVDLLGGVLGGSLIGYYLDKWLGTLPVFFITCFFLGIAGAVRNIFRSIRNAEDLDKKKDEDK